MEIGDKYQARIYFAHSLQKAGMEIFQPFKYNKLLLVPRVDFFFKKRFTKKSLYKIYIQFFIKQL